MLWKQPSEAVIERRLCRRVKMRAEMEHPAVGLPRQRRENVRMPVTESGGPRAGCEVKISSAVF